MAILSGGNIQWRISFRLVTIHGNPILNALLGQAMASHKVVINMIKAFGPRIESFLLELNELGAEATPETRLAVTADATCFELVFDGILIRNLVLFAEMLLEGLLAITHFGAGSSFGSLLIASPCLQLEMLRIFVALPVILAAKGLVACQEGAAVRPLVPLHVFFQLARTAFEFLAHLTGNLIITFVAGHGPRILYFGRSTLIPL